MAGRPWSDAEIGKLKFIKGTFPSMTTGEVSRLFRGRTKAAVWQKWTEIKTTMPPGIPESPYPIYDNPLVMEGDALVLPDPEAPFHHAEFVNRCLELALKWGITQCNIAGDALHFNSLSGWQANWLADQDPGGLSDEHEFMLVELVKRLAPTKQDPFFELIGKIGTAKQDGAPNAATELREARKVLGTIGDLFERVDFVLGNHEGRLLRALNSPLFAEDLKEFLGLTPQWRISPFYYSMLISNGVPFRVTHPKNSARYSASALADKYQSHILMAHSHKFSMIPSRSGKWMGWQIGCCVDERRLPYAAQRDHTGEAHRLGAVIVRDGYVWPLTTDDWCDWDRLMKM